MSKIIDIACIVAAGLLTWQIIDHLGGHDQKPSPAPVKSEGGHRPLLPRRDLVGAKVGGTTSPDGGEEIHCDLPGNLHMKNVGGSDGAGLCVFTSIEHSARHQNVPELLGFQAWMRKRPGGGYPEKVTKMISAYCQERGLVEPRYIQIQNNDLEILKLACKTGRMPGVTYCVSPSGRYGGSRIAHMVNLAHASDRWFAVLDNNYVGESSYEWMSPEEFKRTYTGMGGGWSVILLPPGPPPTPVN